MALYGQFMRNGSGFAGHIRTLFGKAELVLVLAEPSDADNAPNYRIYLDDEDGAEIGAGWNRSSERAGDYISLLLDDPTLPQPIRVHLFQAGDDKQTWNLHWSRPAKRDERA